MKVNSLASTTSYQMYFQNTLTSCLFCSVCLSMFVSHTDICTFTHYYANTHAFFVPHTHIPPPHLPSYSLSMQYTSRKSKSLKILNKSSQFLMFINVQPIALQPSYQQAPGTVTAWLVRLSVARMCSHCTSAQTGWQLPLWTEVRICPYHGTTPHSPTAYTATSNGCILVTMPQKITINNTTDNNKVC